LTPVLGVILDPRAKETIHFEEHPICMPNIEYNCPSLNKLL